MTIYRYTWRTFARELCLLAGAVVFALPFYLLVVDSLKTPAGALENPLVPATHLYLHSYSQAWSAGSVTLGSATLNSAIITGATVICLVILGSVTAYALARRRSRMGTLLYYAFVLGIVLPTQLTVLPLFIAMRALGLVGNYAGMVILYTGAFLPLTVFIYSGFIRRLPLDYEEAAAIDGAPFWRSYVYVVFPLLRPVTGSVAVLTAVFVWNEFFVALIFLSGSRAVTLPVTLYTTAEAVVGQNNVIYAIVVMALAPMVVFFGIAQRQLANGFTGGVKG